MTEPNKVIDEEESSFVSSFSDIEELKDNIVHKA